MSAGTELTQAKEARLASPLPDRVATKEEEQLPPSTGTWNP